MNADKTYDWTNHGDVSPEHGQLWLKAESGDDFASVVEVLTGSEIGLADNQYLIVSGSVYMGNDKTIESAIECTGYPEQEKREFLNVAESVVRYAGFDSDAMNPQTVVQVGKNPDPFTTPYDPTEPDVVLHGNASIARYIESEFLT